METRCPFLKEERVAFCRAFPIKKMLPFDRLYLKDNLCFREDYIHCSTYQDKMGEKTSYSKNKICPFLEVEMVIYCKVYPVKKMIPASCFRLECPCTTDRYIDCPAYERIAQGDIAPAQGEAINVRGFLFDDTMYYHKGHIWLQPINGRLKMGMDDFGQWLLGEIEEIILPRQGEHVKPGHPMLKFRSAQGTAAISSPLHGTIVQVNDETCRDTSLISADPYGQGWLLEMKPDPGELSRLDQQEEQFLHGQKARGWLETEVDRLHHVLQTEIGVTMSDGGNLLGNLQKALEQTQRDLLIKTFLEREEG